MVIHALKRIASLSFFVAVLCLAAHSPLLAQRLPANEKIVDVKAKPYPITPAVNACLPDPAATCLAKVKVSNAVGVVLVMPQMPVAFNINAFVINKGALGITKNVSVPAQNLPTTKYNSTYGGYMLNFSLSD